MKEEVREVRELQRYVLVKESRLPPSVPPYCVARIFVVCLPGWRSPRHVN